MGKVLMHIAWSVLGTLDFTTLDIFTLIICACGSRNRCSRAEHQGRPRYRYLEDGYKTTRTGVQSRVGASRCGEWKIHVIGSENSTAAGLRGMGIGK